MTRKMRSEKDKPRQHKTFRIDGAGNFWIKNIRFTTSSWIILGCLALLGATIALGMALEGSYAK